MDSPVDSLLMLIVLAVHNPELYSNSSRRWTTNCHTLFQHLKISCPDMCQKLELGTQRCGKGALQAIFEFESSARSAMHPDLNEFTLVGLSLIGMSKTQAAAAICEDLICLAVRLAAEGSTVALEAAITECESTGLYNRGLCERDGLTQEPGFLLFDPATRTGRQHWVLLGQLIKARFSASQSLQRELADAKTAWLALSHEGIETGDYISLFNTSYRKLTRVGGEYSDQSKIEYMKKQCSSDLLSAWDGFVRMQTCLGTLDPRLETDYGVFTTCLERVGRSLELKSLEKTRSTDNTAEIKKKKPTEVAADTQDPCWNWTHVGVCSYAGTCKFGHPGTAGQKRNTVTTEDGGCLLFSQGKCNRAACPFKHGDKD
jgi:hypothetical protein